MQRALDRLRREAEEYAEDGYLALDTIEDMRRRQMLSERLTTEDARKHYLKALGKGPPPSSARR